MTLTTYIEIQLDVTYSASKGGPGRRDSLMGKANAGPPLEPDEPPSIEIESITCNGVDFEPTKEQREKIEQDCWEDLRDRNE